MKLLYIHDIFHNKKTAYSSRDLMYKVRSLTAMQHTMRYLFRIKAFFFMKVYKACKAQIVTLET